MCLLSAPTHHTARFHLLVFVKLQGKNASLRSAYLLFLPSTHWQFPPPLTTRQSGVVGSSPTATNSRTALFLDRRNTHCNTTFPASQWQAPLGWLHSPLAQNLRTALFPIHCTESTTVIFSPAKMLLTYLYFYQFLLTSLQQFPYQNLAIVCQIRMLAACKWHYFLFYCQCVPLNVFCVTYLLFAHST